MTPFEMGRSGPRASSRRDDLRRERGRRCVLPGVEWLEGRLLLATSLSTLPFIPPTAPYRLVGTTIFDPDAPAATINAGLIRVVRSSNVQSGQMAIRAIQPSPAPEMVLTPDDTTAAADFNEPLVSSLTKSMLAQPVDATAISDPETMSRDEVVAIPELENAQEMHLSGVLGPDQYYATYKLAVGPTTQKLQIHLSPDPDSPPGFVPAIGSILLANAQGDVIAVIRGAAQKWLGSPAQVTLSLSHIPKDSDLIIQVVQSPISNDPSGSSGETSSGILPFVMDVKRTEAAANGNTPTLSLSGPLFSPINIILPVYSSIASGAGSTFATVATGSLSTLDDSSATDTGASKLSSNTAGLADETPGASTGPLVSRGATPVAPALGTVQGEQTAPVDRQEGIFDFSSGAEVHAGAARLLGAPVLHAVADGVGSSSRDDSQGEARGADSLQVLRGPGGLPLLAASDAGSSHLATASEMIATLPVPSDRPVAVADSEPTQLADETSPQLRRKKLGLMTALFGIAFGVTLTSKPNYPELLSHLRSRRTRDKEDQADGRPRRRRPER